MINLSNFLEFHYSISVNIILLYLWKYYKALNMPYIYRTRKHFRVNLFLTHNFLWIWCGPRLTLDCFHFNVQLQSGTDFSVYSQWHMVWASSVKSLYNPRALDEPVGSPVLSYLQTPWSSSKVKLQGLNVDHMCRCVDWPVTLETATKQQMMNMPFFFLKWLLSQYGCKQCEPTVSFYSVNTCCLILWRNILVILKEPRVGECFVQSPSIVSSFEIQCPSRFSFIYWTHNNLNS